MKIGLFGGSFNPITESHITVATNILDTGLVDAIWFFPCYVSYYNKSLVSAEHRMEMLRIAIKDWNIEHVGKYNCKFPLSICDFEITNKLVAESYDVMIKFNETYNDPKYQFYFIIGMDNANKIHTWSNFDKLTLMLPFIIIPRVGYTEEANINWYKQSPHIYLDKMDALDGSSTVVRDAIKNNVVCPLLNDNVLQYIKQHDLYIF
jgi:nicotinate-nucleotide adenylyltransferase